MQTPAQASEGPALDPTESDAGDATQGHEPSNPRPDSAASLPGATEIAPAGGTDSETAASGEQAPEAHAHDGVPRRRRRRRRRNRRRRRRRPPVGAPSPNAGSTADSTAEPASGDGVASAAARTDMPATENAPSGAPGTRPARP